MKPFPFIRFIDRYLHVLLSSVSSSFLSINSFSHCTHRSILKLWHALFLDKWNTIYIYVLQNYIRFVYLEYDHRGDHHSLAGSWSLICRSWSFREADAITSEINIQHRIVTYVTSRRGTVSFLNDVVKEQAKLKMSATSRRCLVKRRPFIQLAIISVVAAVNDGNAYYPTTNV